MVHGTKWVAFSCGLALLGASFGLLPSGGVAFAQNTGAGKTETADGLHTTTFDTPRGRIHVNLPDDMAAGDTISGTVVAEPAGKNDGERAKNQDELNGYVVEVEQQKVSTSGKKFRWTIPSNAATAAATLNLRDKGGKEVGRASVPVLSAPPITAHPAQPSASDFQLPQLGQAGRPIEIPGPFDGNLSNTSLKVGGTDATLLAESPRKVVAASPLEVTGPTTLELKQNAVTATGPYRNLGIQLTAPKTNLLRGEHTTLTVTVDGLQGLKEPVCVHLQNNSMNVVRIGGGDLQDITFGPASLSQGHTGSREFTLVGVQPGNFSIRAKVQPEPTGELTDQEASAVLPQLDSGTWSDALAMFNQVQSANLAAGAPPITASLRDKFLKWWFEYLEAMNAYEMLDGWITSPFHYPLDEGDVRAQVRTQITLLTEGAKKKLIQRLKDRAKALRDKAKDLKNQGKTADAERAEAQANGFDQAASEVQQSMSSTSGAKP